MFTMLNSALKSIIDLLYRRSEARKLRVETQIAEHDLELKTRRVRLASFSETQKYDPKMEEFEYAIKKDVRNNPIAREVGESRLGQLRWLILLGVIVIVILASIMIFRAIQ